MFHEVPQKKMNSHFTVTLVQHEIKWKLHCSPTSPAQLGADNKLVLVCSVTDCCHTPKGYLCTYSPVVHGRRGKSTVITTSVLHLDGHVIFLCPRHPMGPFPGTWNSYIWAVFFLWNIFTCNHTKGISCCRFSGKFTISLKTIVRFRSKF
jgi:hypothetical protein